jgi:hypothetical protein
VPAPSGRSRRPNTPGRTRNIVASDCVDLQDGSVNGHDVVVEFGVEPAQLGQLEQRVSRPGG